MERARLGGAVLGLALILGAAVAEAQVAPGDAGVIPPAHQHVEEGNQLYRRKQYAEALAKYRQAQALEPTPNLLFNIAQCLRKLGKLEEALGLYKQFLASNPAAETRA